MMTVTVEKVGYIIFLIAHMLKDVASILQLEKQATSEEELEGLWYETTTSCKELLQPWCFLKEELRELHLHALSAGTPLM